MHIKINGQVTRISARVPSGNTGEMESFFAYGEDVSGRSCATSFHSLPRSAFVNGGTFRTSGNVYEISVKKVVEQ